MNAHELADLLETTESTNNKASTMLRQQQAEIESMQERMIVAEKELNHMRSFFGCDPAYYGMTPAEPVAYRWKSDLGYIYNIYDYGNGQPLYRHPSEHDLGIAEAIGFDKGYKAATANTLTDAEFDNIFANGKRLGVLETEDRFRKAINLTDKTIEDALYVADITLENLSDGDISIERIKAFARTILRKSQV